MTRPLAIYRNYDLPWTTGAEQERSFRKILKASLAALLALALVLSLLPPPRLDESDVPEIPERFARLVIEQPKPPPPPPVAREKPKAKAEAKPEPPKGEPPNAEPPKAESKPAPERPAEQPPKARPKAPPPPPSPPDPSARAREARAEASAAGLLPFAEQLAVLRDDAAVVERLDGKQQLGIGADTAAPVTERALITSKVGRGSSGINTARLSRNIGGTGLSGRVTTKVENPLAGLAAGGGGAGAGGSGEGVTRRGRSDRASRSREEIERVFDKNKGAIYALYNRALRQNPALQGKVVLRLTIAPDGRVTDCVVVSSELGDRELEEKLVQRVKLFKFEAKDVEAITTTKPIDFFPA